MTARKRDVESTPSEDGQALPASAGSALAFEVAIAEFFDWLTESEIAEDEVGNVQARDAIARASSQLGCLLIKHGVYTQNDKVERREAFAPTPGSDSEKGKL